MAQPLRTEDPNKVSFLTTRTRRSELWFVNNRALANAICGYIAKYAQVYDVILYALNIQGNHVHLLAGFPNKNRAAFMRDVNAAVQRCVKYYQKKFLGGSLWSRRYSEQWVPNRSDIEDKFFYCALQPVNAGLCAKISDYPGYNSFSAAAAGREELYSVFDYSAYYRASRTRRQIKRIDFIRKYPLIFRRLPGYELFSVSEYRQQLLEKLERRRCELIEKRRSEGKTQFLGRRALLETVAGSVPHMTKTSRRDGYRPLVLTSCSDTREKCLEFYFNTLELYRIASKLFRAGALTVPFPVGTYRPISESVSP